MESSSNDRPRFPVVVFTSDTYLIFKTEDDFRTCTKLGLKSGYYTSALIIDANLDSYTIPRQPEIVSSNIFSHFISGKVRVALYYQHEGKWPFERLKEELQNRVAEDEDAEATWDVEVLDQRLKAATSFEDLVEALESS